MRKRAYLLGREMIWSQVAHLFMASFQRARRAAAALPRRTQRLRTLDEAQQALPSWKMDHLLRLTDSVGIFQHAKYTFPRYADGYCTDDNARALILAVLLEELGQAGPEIQRASSAYAAFLDYAWNPDRCRFHNFLGFDRRWAPGDGSDDCLGRALWALGTCVGRSKNRGLQVWAAQAFEGPLRAVLTCTSPRAWAFALLGIHEYLRRLSGDRLAAQAREQLASRLMELYQRNATDDWPWFEDRVTYGNAKLPHALILSGRWMENGEMLEAGLHALRWLSQIQKSPGGWFRPIGNDGFLARGQAPAQHDQQPIEAHGMVSAAIEAFHCTQDLHWLTEAKLAFEWFLGRNDLGKPLYDSTTGGCRDGLQEDRLNENQGAESTLAFLLSLAEMRILESRLTTMERVEGDGKVRQPIPTT